VAVCEGREPERESGGAAFHNNHKGLKEKEPKEINKAINSHFAKPALFNMSYFSLKRNLILNSSLITNKKALGNASPRAFGFFAIVCVS